MKFVVRSFYCMNNHGNKKTDDLEGLDMAAANLYRNKKCKIRLLHLVRSLKIAGAEILLVHYIRALGTERYEHFVYNFGHDGPIRGRLEDLGISVTIGPKRASIKNPIKFSISLFSLVNDLIKFIKSNHIQMIQSHLSDANQLAVVVAKLAKIPVFPTIHSTMEFEDIRSKWDPRVCLSKVIYFFISILADRIIAVSEEVKEITRTQFHLKASKIVVVKNGIILREFNTRSAELANEFPDAVNRLKIIAVGRLNYSKGFDVIVRAIAEAVKSGDSRFFVMLVGGGDGKTLIEELINDLGVGSQVKLLGIRQDVVELMRSSDLMVIPSRFEGLSLAMIEAMACGLPIIASDAPGLKTYITNEKTGLLFPLDDHKAMAKCILRLAADKDLRIKLSQEAGKMYKNDFDMYRNIRPLDKLFQKFSSMN